MNFNADFIENFSELTKWEWNDEHQGAFNRNKNTFCEYTILSYFNPCWEIEVICDGSPFGVSDILTQINPDNAERKVVAYASLSLSDAETR